jgi:hypothetical protein
MFVEEAIIAVLHVERAIQNGRPAKEEDDGPSAENAEGQHYR